MVAIWSVHHKTWQVIYYCALLAEQMPGLELRYEEREPSQYYNKSTRFSGALFLRLSLSEKLKCRCIHERERKISFILARGAAEHNPLLFHFFGGLSLSYFHPPCA